MSVSNKYRSGAVREHRYRSSGDVRPSGDVNDEEGGGATDTGGRKEGDDNRKEKKVSFFRFRKVKRRKQRGNSVAPGCFGRAAFGGGGECFLCLKPPRTTDSQSQSQARDPNSPDFGYEMLRVLIEKNDFYSKECNPHLDEQFVPSCSHQSIDM